MPESMRLEDVPQDLVDDAVDAWHDAGDNVLLDDRCRAIVAALTSKIRRMWWIELFGDLEEQRKETLRPDSREQIQALIDATTERVIRNRLADEVLESPLLLCKLGLSCRENVAAFLRGERW